MTLRPKLPLVGRLQGNAAARRLGLAFAGLPLLLGLAAPAVAQGSGAPGMTAGQVIAFAARAEGRTPFKAVREQQVTRQDMVLHAEANVNFKAATDYQLSVTQSSTTHNVNGLNLVLASNHLTVFFPKESLLFQSDISAGSEEAKDLILGKLTDSPALLARNYKVTLDPQADVVALYPCYKLTLEPVRGLGPQSPPGKRIWINKENGVVMKEERFWTRDTASYFISDYKDFSTVRPPAIKLNIPRDVSKLRLAKGSPTNMVRYASVAAARAAGETIYAPAYVPEGFVLKAVDIMKLYGTDIVIMRYSDGLNSLALTYRAKPNAFLTLMAGAFALSLVDKITSLSYHAPNNYASVEKGNDYVYAYGDLYVDTLKRIANSVPIPKPAKNGQRPAQSAVASR